MKKNILLLVIFALLFSSCTNDIDDTIDDVSVDNTTTDTSSGNYLPLKNGNFWTYDVVSSNPTTRDSLYIGNDTIIDSKTYKKMKTRNIVTGFYATSLRNNGLRADGDMLKLAGNISFTTGVGTPIAIQIQDLIILKTNSNANELLGTVSGTTSQTISGYPLVFNYVLKTISDGDLTTFTATNPLYNTPYSDIKKTKVILNLEIKATVTYNGFPLVISVMNPQDVVVSTQYYAKNIGMVYAKTITSYTLNSIPGITLPFPSSGSQMQEEFLKTYLINP